MLSVSSFIFSLWETNSHKNTYTSNIPATHSNPLTVQNILMLTNHNKKNGRESISEDNDIKNTKFGGKLMEFHRCKVNSMDTIYASTISPIMSPILSQFHCSIQLNSSYFANVPSVLLIKHKKTTHSTITTTL